jgi:hypothetical protein
MEQLIQELYVRETALFAALFDNDKKKEKKKLTTISILIQTEHADVHRRKKQLIGQSA